MGLKNCKPQPGDLIEIFRPGYQHWAIYVGDGYVIHVADEEPWSFPPSSSSKRAKRAKVKMQHHDEVLKGHKWRVNNKYDYLCKPRPVNDIVRDAQKRIGDEVTYDETTVMCEHFVTELRYGKKIYRLVKMAAAGCAYVGAASFVTGLPIAATAGLAAVAAAGRFACSSAVDWMTGSKRSHP